MKCSSMKTIKVVFPHGLIAGLIENIIFYACEAGVNWCS